MTRLLRVWMVFQAACLAGSLCAAPRIARKAQRPSADALTLLWHSPQPMTASDWFWGPGGKERSPVRPFQFIREDLSGTNPKVDVKDARGAIWRVKFGQEVHSDTFAPRLVYAAGYFAEPTYFIPEGIIEGAHHLKRAKPFISRNGNFRYARFKLHDTGTLSHAEEYSWSWKENPFVGSHELNGLKLLMMLTSNWDGKDATDSDGNTSVFLRQADSAYVYLFTDWGATMGKWGGYFSRNKWDSRGYASQTKKLVRGVSANGEIEWGFSGKHGRDLTQGISVADVRWLVPYLSRFTDAEIHAGLVASGARPDQVELFAGALRRRIRELQQLSYEREASVQQR